MIVWLGYRPLATTGFKDWLWLAAVAFINALMLVAAHTAWTYVGKRVEVLDDILQPAQGYREVIAWLDRRLSRRQQLIIPTVGAICGPLFMWVVELQRGPTSDAGLATYLTVALTSFIGGNVGYWLWTGPGFAKRAYRAGRLNVRWQDPASTPAIRLAAEGYGVSALFLLAGTLSMGVTGFAFSTAKTVPALQIAHAAFFLLVAATSVRVGIAPFVYMYAIVANAKRDTLSLLDRHIPTVDRVLREWPGGQYPALLGLYSQVSSTPNLPFSTAALVQYGAVLVGAVLAFITSLILQ